MEYVKIPNVFERDEKTKKLIDGEYSTPELKMLSEIPWVWTEKVDGTNIRVIWDGYRVELRGRTDKAQIPKDLLSRLEELFCGESNEELFEKKFGETPAILYGEGYGGKIQSGALYGDKPDFILFDIFCGGLWLKRDVVEGIGMYFGLKTVPAIRIGTLPQAVEFVKEHPHSLLKDDTMEGIVCRPLEELRDRRGNRIIVKIKCRDFPKVSGE